MANHSFPIGAVRQRDITIAAGTKASLAYGALAPHLDTTFGMSITGALAPTIQTLPDGGGGQSVSGAGTNALVIHYTPGVSTRALIEALFPVAVASGSVVVKTAGVSVAFLADPADTIPATPLAGGTAGDLTAAAHTQTFNIGTDLPAGAWVLQWEQHTSTKFSDGAGCTASIDGTGITADVSLATGAFYKGGAAVPLAAGPSIQVGGTTPQVVFSSGVNLNTIYLGSVKLSVLYVTPEG